MSHQQIPPEGQMICSLIKSLHREEKEVNYKILPNLLMEKHVCITLSTTTLSDSFLTLVHGGVFLVCFMKQTSSLTPSVAFQWISGRFQSRLRLSLSGAGSMWHNMLLFIHVILIIYVSCTLQCSATCRFSINSVLAWRHATHSWYPWLTF